jgi:hypothetical protein
MTPYFRISSGIHQAALDPDDERALDSLMDFRAGPDDCGECGELEFDCICDEEK